MLFAITVSGNFFFGGAYEYADGPRPTGSTEYETTGRLRGFSKDADGLMVSCMRSFYKNDGGSFILELII